MLTTLSKYARLTLSCSIFLLFFKADYTLATPPLSQLGATEDIHIPRDPLSVDVSPDGESVYMVGPSWLTHFSRDLETGNLSFDGSLFQVQRELEIPGLADPQEIRVSPNGEYVYLPNPGIEPPNGTMHGLTIFRRAEDGSLTLIGTFDEGLAEDNSARGMALAISSDGRHLYLSGAGAKSITLVEQLPDGNLQLREQYAGRGRYESIAISEDGEFVYLGRSALESSEIRVYRRNPVSGQLDLLSSQTFPLDGQGFTELTQLATSGTHLYALGCVACGPDTRTSGVLVFEQQEDGQLSLIQTVDEAIALTSLRISADGRHLYSLIGSALGSTFSVFSRDPQTGQLEFVDSPTVGSRIPGGGPFAISPDGKNIYAGSFDGLPIARITLDPTTGLPSELEQNTPGTSGFRGFGSPQLLLTSPDNRFLYTSSRTLNALAAIDTSAGLTGEVVQSYLEGWSDETAPSQLDHAVMSRDGRHIYGAAEDRLAIFLRRDMQTGALEEISSEETFQTFGIALSPDETYLLSAGLFGINLREADISFVLHDRQAADGSLSNRRALNNVSQDNGFFLLGTDLDFSPDGRFAYAPIATSFFGGRAGLAVILVNPEDPDEPLTIVDTQIDIQRRSDRPRNPVLRTVISADGQHLYLANTEDQSLRVYQRNMDDGSLDLLETHQNDEDGISGLLEANDLDLHPQGRLLVVADRSGHALTVFERDPMTGFLRFLGTLGRENEDGLELPTHLTFSTGGQFLYVASEDRGTLATFTTQCTDSNTVLCLQEGRFRVEVNWRDFEDQTGSGIAVSERSNDSGMFWFFDPNNWEMLIKVLDGCAINQHFWVFSAATTNVEYQLRVTDSQNGRTRIYENPLGQSADAVTDTGAFSCSE